MSILKQVLIVGWLMSPSLQFSEDSSLSSLISNIPVRFDWSKAMWSHIQYPFLDFPSKCKLFFKLIILQMQHILGVYKFSESAQDIVGSHSWKSCRSSFVTWREPSARGRNWTILFLGDMNTGTWPSRLGESQMRQ
jgi:hypothetical protein